MDGLGGFICFPYCSGFLLGGRLFSGTLKSGQLCG
jgi:hypothetical protein